MDRLALSLIALGLLMILGTVTAVLGGASAGISGLAAVSAALAGAAIIAGLAMLERRAFRPSAGRALIVAAPRPLPASLADGAA